MYDLYIPLRNQIHRNSLIPSLYVIWAWMQRLQFDVALPGNIEVPNGTRDAKSSQERGFYEWELALLAKELIAQCPLKGEADFRRWWRFSSAVNALKNLDNAISGRYEELFRREVLIEMYRSAHHQFDWQHPETLFSTVARYFKIFGTPALDSVLESATGLNTRALYKIGMSAAGHFLQEFVLASPPSFALQGVNADQVTYFFQTYARDLDFVRSECVAKTSFNEDFIYSENPLLQYPMIRITEGNVPGLVAPVPRFLMRRFTEGVYYDILSAPGFDQAFGESFQSYVGEVLTARNPNNAMDIEPERLYRIGTNQLRSIDWITSDDHGDLFIECKTKRVRRDAKIALADLTPLRSELSKLADSVVQIYKTLRHALDGAYEHWKPRGLPIYPIIVTLVDWFFFGHRLAAEIEPLIRERLAQNGLAPTMLDEFPYTVCSAEEFERFMGIVERRGIAVVMAERFRGERRHWLLHSVMHRAFPTEYAETRPWLFPKALDEVTGELTTVDGVPTSSDVTSA